MLQVIIGKIGKNAVETSSLKRAAMGSSVRMLEGQLAYFLIKKINVIFKNLLVHTYVHMCVYAHSFLCDTVYTGQERRAEGSFQG